MNLKPGTKCFAKVKGYSPWPARIDVLPTDVKIPRGKYPVFFYGTHEVSYVTAKDIFDFEKYRSKYGALKGKNTKFNDGISEIDNNPTIYQLGFDKRAVDFLSQFYKFDSKKFDHESSHLSEPCHKLDNKQKPSGSVQDRKRRRSVGDTTDENEPKLKAIKIEINEEQNQSSQAKMELENEILIQLTPIDKRIFLKAEEESDSKNEKVEVFEKEKENTCATVNPVLSCIFETENEKIINSFKSPIKAFNSDRPKRASAIKFKQNFKSYLQNLSPNSKMINKKPDSLFKTRKDNAKIKKAERKSILSEENICKTSENQFELQSIPINDLAKEEFRNQTNQTDHSSSTSKADNKDENNLRIVSKLSIIDKEIKRSLLVGNENHEKCRKMMRNLLEMTYLNLILICRVPEIIVTIRKCRRYKKDDVIKISASKIYSYFCQIYEEADLDEKVLAGTELLKRDPNSCKSAQTLFNELFVTEKHQTAKNQQSNVILSSPSSAQSIHSSANNTPLLNNDTSTDASESGVGLDPDVVNLNDLIKSGVLTVIDSYSFEGSVKSCKRKSSGGTKQMMTLNDDVELYKQLGV